MESVDTCGALAVSPVSCPTPVVVGAAQLTAGCEQMHSLKSRVKEVHLTMLG